ncbi:MAG TPA: hypothetical protein ENH47_01705, partial [Ignavibacteriales bacterium]|nr:hypothetical protein [Ignavibacteriales bacterium]
MAMMAKMRSLAPAFILTVGVLFVLFMVISDSNVMRALGGRSNNVGSVNGQDISYKEFQSRIEAERQALQQSGKEVDDENTEQFRDQVWSRMVNEILLKQQMDKMGIEVSDEEVRAVILGDNPPAYLKQNFIDSTGNFNRQMYEQAIYNPQNKEVLIQVENRVRNELEFSKLQSMLLASVTVGEDEVLRKFKDQNIYVNDAQYTLISKNLFPDSLVHLTEDDLRKYYDDNIDKYDAKPQRKLRFVLFKDEPSAKDSEIVIENLKYVKANFSKDTSDFKYYIGIYSSKPYSVDTLDVSSFSTEGIKQIQSAKIGDLVGPVAAPDGITLYHLLKVIPSKKEMRRASHILINQFGSDEENLKEANKIYKELIAGGNFEEIAKEKSKDPGSARVGGDLGWFGRGRMIKEFEEAVFNGKIGVVQKPVKTSFGYHIIKVTGISNKKYIVERIINPVKESATTKDERFNNAKDFAYLADKNGFEKEANLMNYKVQETGYFTEDAVSIPGLGINKRVVEFAFDNGLNSIGEVYKIQKGFIVPQVSEVKDGGIIPFDEVKEQMRPAVLIEKKFEIAKSFAEDLRAEINGDLNKVKKIDPRLTVKNTGRFNATTSIPGIGLDYAFIETALKLEPNKISEPVKSNTGYYLIKVISKTAYDSSAYAAQSSTIRNNIIQQKKQ